MAMGKELKDLKLECPSGCGEVEPKSPIDHRYHCLKCGGIFTDSQMLDMIKKSGDFDLIVDNLEAYYDGMDEDGALEALTKTIETFGQQVKGDRLRHMASSLWSIVNEIEDATKIKVPRINIGHMMLNIMLNWDDGGDGPDAEPEPDPDPSSPEKKTVLA